MTSLLLSAIAAKNKLAIEPDKKLLGGYFTLCNELQEI